MNNAFYACAAPHHRYVIEGMRKAGFRSSLAGPYRPSSVTVALTHSLPLPSALAAPLRQRGSAPAPVADRNLQLGVGQFVLPLLLRSGRSPGTRARRFAMARQALRVESLVRRGSFDLIQFTDGLGHRLSRRRIGSSLVVCERRNMHHRMFYELGREPVAGFPFVRLQRDPIEDMLDYEYELADRILVYSAVAADSFVAQGVDSDKLVTVPLPCPSPSNQHWSQNLSGDFLYVGRCEATKGLDLAVDAARLLGKRLRVVGPASPDVRSWLDGRPNVKYVGLLSSAGVVEEMARCALLLMPSIESFSLVVGEAVALGVPCVVSPLTGIGGVLGLDDFGLVAELSSERIAMAASSVLELTAEHANSLSEALRQRAQTMGESECAQRWIDGVGALL